MYTGKKKLKFTAIPSFDEGVEIMTKFASTNGLECAYALLMDDEGELKYYERKNMPCYGELRPYGSTHDDPIGEGNNVGKPGDLFYPFPNGTPIMLAVPLQSPVPVDSVYLDKENSPWRSILHDADYILQGKHVKGIVFPNMEIDPTVVVNFLRKISGESYYNKKTFIGDYHPTIQLIANQYISEMYVDRVMSKVLLRKDNHDYLLFGGGDWCRIFNGDPLDLTEGKTFSQRGVYNRPKNDFIFGREGVDQYNAFVNDHKEMIKTPLTKSMYETFLKYIEGVVKSN